MRNVGNVIQMGRVFKALQVTQVDIFLQQWDYSQQQVIIPQLSLDNSILQVHQQQVHIHFLHLPLLL